MNSILIIDDTKMILHMAKNIIEENISDIDITVESNPINGKERLRTETYQIIILDIIMPNLSGIELLAWIKKQKHLAETKIIMFTSLNDSSALVESFKIGAYDFISKPIEKNEFIARVNHAIVEYNQEEIIRTNLREIKKKNSELKSLNEKLSSMRVELLQSERLASVGYFAAGMAHEINNPLGFVRSNFLTLKENVSEVLELYRESKNYSMQIGKEEEVLKKYQCLEEKYDFDFISEDVNDIFSDIQHGTKRIEAIISALRNFSEIDSEGKKEIVFISNVFDNIKTMTQVKFKENTRLILDDEVKKPIYCKKGEFNLSILELVNNAYEAIEKKGEMYSGLIRIKVVEIDRFIQIIIEDNGVGMKKETKKYAINPFYTTKDVGEGVGIGLSTAYNFFVNEMKGSLVIESIEGEGTEIEISIPRSEWELTDVVDIND